jgi:hypothetical protein
LLPQPQYVKFNRSALTRSDLLTRYQAHQIALTNEWKTINEVRDDEDMNAVPWGDVPISGTAAKPSGVDAQTDPTAPPQEQGTEH